MYDPAYIVWWDLHERWPSVTFKYDSITFLQYIVQFIYTDVCTTSLQRPDGSGRKVYGVLDRRRHTRARAFSAHQPSPANTNEDRRDMSLPAISLLLVAALVKCPKKKRKKNKTHSQRNSTAEQLLATKIRSSLFGSFFCPPVFFFLAFGSFRTLCDESCVGEPVKVVWPPTVNLAKDMRELKRGRNRNCSSSGSWDVFRQKKKINIPGPNDFDKITDVRSLFPASIGETKQTNSITRRRRRKTRDKKLASPSDMCAVVPTPVLMSL